MTAPSLRTTLLPLPELASSSRPRQRLRCSSERLSWRKTSVFGSEYALLSAGHRVAALSVRGFFHPSASGEAFGRSWEIGPYDREHGCIVVRESESLQEAGVFEMIAPGSGGVVRTASGRVFIFRSDFWKGVASFLTADGDTTIEFRYRGVFRPSAEIEIHGRTESPEELGWIILLGWCLIVAYL